MKRFFVIFLIFCIGYGLYFLFNIQRQRDTSQYGLGLEPSIQKLQQSCQDAAGNKLSYAEAIEIAQKSDCMILADAKVSLSQTYFCNENTSTFWIDIQTTPAKAGCSPACVVNIVNKTAEINWRCTGGVQ